MKTAVIAEGQTEGIVRALIDPARHYGFHPSLGTHRAKTKGKVEGPFRYVLGGLLPCAILSQSRRTECPTPALAGRGRQSKRSCHDITLRVVNEAFSEARAHLRPLPWLDSAPSA
jgi:hypothetical protein